MAIRDITIPEEVLSCGPTPITLRALSLESLCKVLGEQFGQIREVADLLMKDFQFLGFSEGMAMSALARAPELVATIIASSAGEPETVDAVKRLPAGFQVHALAVIARLTMAGTDQLILADKLSAAVAPLLQKPASVSTH